MNAFYAAHSFNFKQGKGRLDHEFEELVKGETLRSGSP